MRHIHTILALGQRSFGAACHPICDHPEWEFEVVNNSFIIFLKLPFEVQLNLGFELN